MSKEIIVCDYHQQAAEYMNRTHLERSQCIIITKPEQMQGMEFDSCVMLSTDKHMQNVAKSRMGRRIVA